MLTSGILKRYRQPFLLDEDALSRIHALLEKAGKELPNSTNVIFRVNRDDDRYYETLDIADVLSDPNMIGKRIDYVAIELRYSDEKKKLDERFWLAVVQFSKGRESVIRNFDEITIRIAADNKNWALLLADDLQPQVERTLKVKSTSRVLLTFFILPFFIASFRLSTFVSPTSPVLSISSFTLMLIFGMGYLFGAFSPLYVTEFDKGFAKWFIPLFGPETVFVWGEESQAHSEREKTRQNVMWGVIVALLVSILASFLFLFLWNSPN